MNFTHLRAFYSVARNKSFTLACRELNVSQSTVSLHVMELERFYNIPLLNRTGRNFELTKEGQLVLSYAEKIFSLSNEMENTLEDLNQLHSGTLKIGVTLVTLKNFVPNFVSSLKSKHPEIKIQVFTGVSNDILSKVIDYEYHVGVLARMTYPDNLITRQISKVGLHFITSDKFKEKIDLKDLANYPIILPSEGAAVREIIIYEFKKRNIPLNIYLETEDPEILKSMVHAGVGGAFLPLGAIDEELKEKKFRVVEISDQLHFYYDMIFLEERRTTKSVRAIISAINDLGSFENP